MTAGLTPSRSPLPAPLLLGLPYTPARCHGSQPPAACKVTDIMKLMTESGAAQVSHRQNSSEAPMTIKEGSYAFVRTEPNCTLKASASSVRHAWCRDMTDVAQAVASHLKSRIYRIRRDPLDSPLQLIGVPQPRPMWFIREAQVPTWRSLARGGGGGRSGAGLREARRFRDPDKPRSCEAAPPPGPLC